MFAGKLYFYMDSMVKRADDRAVSLVYYDRSFTGGAHSNYAYAAINIDPNTGEIIKLSDVVKDQTELKKALIDKFREEYPDMQFLQSDEPFGAYDFTLTDSTDDRFAFNFTLEPDGLCFYFSPYELGSYAEGAQIVKLLYSEMPALFVNDYSVEGGYASGLCSVDYYAFGGEGSYDLSGDGSTDRILVMGLTDEDAGEYADYFTKIRVEKNGQSVENDLYCYSMDSFLMHTDDGKDYLYVIGHQDNDWSSLSIYDLNGEKPELIDLTGYGLPLVEDKEQERYGYLQITDVSDFMLDVHCDLLASFKACFHTSVGTDGKPVLPEDGFYDVPDYVGTLKSKAEIKAPIVDESGKTVEQEAAIPAGETFKLYRTDGAFVIDAKLSDGRIARLELERSDDDYSAVINGQIREEDAFETLLYAG